jgi:hypothetical protein
MKFGSSELMESMQESSYESRDDSHFRAVQWSPNGKRLAYIKISARSGAQIELGDPKGRQPTVLLSGTAMRDVTRLEDGFRDLNWLPDGSVVPEIRVKRDTLLSTISWAANGNGWFASNRTQQGADLL